MTLMRDLRWRADKNQPDAGFDLDQCATCESSVFGMIEDDNLRYCNEKCQQSGRLRHADPKAAKLANEWYHGTCNECGRSGLVDLRFRYSVMSAVFVRYSHKQFMLSCRQCAQGKQARALIKCLLFGWWGFSGFFMTPTYVWRNLRAMLARATGSPSPALLEMAHRQLFPRRVGQAVSTPVDILQVS